MTPFEFIGDFLVAFKPSEIKRGLSSPFFRRVVIPAGVLLVGAAVFKQSERKISRRSTQRAQERSMEEN